MISAQAHIPFIYCRHKFLYLATIAICLLTIVRAEASPSALSVQVEVFTTTSRMVVGQPADIKKRKDGDHVEIEVYELDEIQLVEEQLSRDLPTNPDQAKRLVIHRISDMDEQYRAHLQRSAFSLTRAIQYGINRYPAVVFDETTVVYGVVDLVEALRIYQRWLDVGGL